MALVRGPLFSAEASGSVGAVTYQRGRYGQVARNRVLPVKPRTTAASDYRSDVFSFAINKYQSMNTTSRGKWVDFAMRFPGRDRWGQPQNWSAQNWFMRLNVQALYYHQTFSFTPPAHPNIDYFPIMNIQFSASGFSLSWLTAIPADMAIVVFQYRTLRSLPISRRNLVHSHTFTDSDTSPQFVTPAPDGPGGPGSLPPYSTGTFIQFSVGTVDNAGRSSNRLFFNLQATL